MTVEQALAILRVVLLPKCLSRIQELVFRRAWEGQSYEKIAAASGYDAAYIRHIGSHLWQLLSESFGKQVTKRNFRSVLMHRSSQTDGETVKPMSSRTLSHQSPTRFDRAIDISFYYEQTKELDNLKNWIVNDRWQLATIVGIDGISKTIISVKPAEQMQDKCHYLIRRSRRNPPPVEAGGAGEAGGEGKSGGGGAGEANLLRNEGLLPTRSPNS